MSEPTTSDSMELMPKPPVARTLIGGVLMGLANLVPGVSGGTMILVTGLYDEFITSIADVTRLKFTRRNLLFLVVLGAGAAVAIGGFAGTLSRAVTLHRSAMYSLFIGLTLGGAPLLIRMIGAFRGPAVAGALAGLALMLVIAFTNKARPESDAIKEAVARGEFVIEPAYVRDVLGGALGMAAMVLPGISGAYMLLIIDRYTTVLASIELAKQYVFKGGHTDPTGFLSVIIPTAIGAVLSLVLLSNALKWLLHRHEKPTLGFLLGILVGSVFGIWPFDASSTGTEYGVAAALAVGGFIATTLLARLGNHGNAA